MNFTGSYMRKRRALLVGFGLLAIVGVVGFLAFWQTASKHRINDQSVELIQKGMTQAEVEAVFGSPPGDYSVEKTGNENTISINAYYLGPNAKRWIDDEMTVAVFFNAFGKVEICSVERRTIFGDEYFWTKFRRWLGL